MRFPRCLFFLCCSIYSFAGTDGICIRGLNPLVNTQVSLSQDIAVGSGREECLSARKDAELLCGLLFMTVAKSQKANTRLPKNYRLKVEIQIDEVAFAFWIHAGATSVEYRDKQYAIDRNSQSMILDVFRGMFPDLFIGNQFRPRIKEERGNVNQRGNLVLP
ncbi:hypothetical protein [Mesoterricola sediminis]|uniref:hypothetical protein n=1 Tax=Mesoterricola sediminis TaxID=2927980 RepID=UPI002930AF19|nr:hypothetical protein [Mesoterricola sediminis]